MLMVKNNLLSTFTASLTAFKFSLSNTVSSAAPQIQLYCIGGCWDWTQTVAMCALTSNVSITRLIYRLFLIHCKLIVKLILAAEKIRYLGMYLYTIHVRNVETF
jgi:hypothetical protein